MPIISEAQIIIEELPAQEAPVHFHLDDVVVYDEEPSKEEVIEIHDEPHQEHSHEHSDLTLSLPSIPGAPAEAQDELMVEDEEPVEIEEEKRSSSDPWDWSKRPDFLEWASERIQAVPSHSGYDKVGLERAISYLERLLSEISRAMRGDLDGDLDSEKVSHLYAQVEEGIERLHDRLAKVDSKKGKRKKKASEEAGITKQASPTPRIGGIVVTVSLLIHRCARTCINGMVSGGKDIEDLFDRQVEKYKLNDREKVELLQLIEDMGAPVNRERLRSLDKDEEEDGGEWIKNYPA